MVKNANLVCEMRRVRIGSHAWALVFQQVCAGPLARYSPVRVPDVNRAQAQRRFARMSPLWRIMNSKPLGAYCQNNYECSTGLCR